jgi:predicted nucleotidyltransferase
MELEKIRNEIKQVGNSLSTKTKLVEAYLFGSILTSPKNANDVDLLILYNSSEQIDIIKQEIKKLERLIPLHLTYFTFEEEIEFKFISEVNGEIVFKI